MTGGVMIAYLVFSKFLESVDTKCLVDQGVGTYRLDGKFLSIVSKLTILCQ